MTDSTGPFAEVVVGAVDVDAVLGFLGLFGLEEFERLQISDPEADALYGLDRVEGDSVRLASARTGGRSTVLVVPAPRVGDAASGWRAGPRALDLYSTDLDESLSMARAADWAPSPEAVLAGGAMRMRQAMVRGPEHLPVVLVDSTHRRSTICDLPDAPLHSEPHSVVWVVDDHAAEVARWVAAGWTAGARLTFSEPSVSDELALPERPTPITMTMLSDPRVLPVRLELMTFDDHREAAVAGPAVLAGGLFALAVEVVSIDAAMRAWGNGAGFGPVVPRSDGRRAVRGETVGGVRFVLVERG